MKKILLALVAIMATFGTMKADKYTIDRSELPAQAQEKPFSICYTIEENKHKGGSAIQLFVKEIHPE